VTPLSEFQLPEDTATLVIDYGRFNGAEIECRLSVGYDVYVQIDEFGRTFARDAENADQGCSRRRWRCSPRTC
jgi:hypothetical protein